MLGYIIKLVFLVIVTMIGLNIFVPERADAILSSFSNVTEIEEKTLKENLDRVTKFTQDTIAEVSQKIKKNFEE
jgi:hypothetical protein